jgi:elongation factor Tu
MEVRDLLTQYEFRVTRFRSLRVQALKALNGDADQERRSSRWWPRWMITSRSGASDRSAVPDAGEDVFNIEGRGTVATGRVERGILKKMEEVEIVGISDTAKTTCTDIEMFRKLLDEARAGDNVGLLLRGIKKEDVQRGQVIAKPAPSSRTRSSRPRSTFSRRTRVAVTRRSSRTTVRSSTSARPT